MTLRSDRVLSFADVPHLFTLRDPSQPGFGNVSFKYGQTSQVLENRAEALRAMNQDASHLVLASQPHRTHVHRVTERDRGRGALEDTSRVSDADGLVTDVVNLPIGVLVADCCCLLVADRNRRAVGAFHAGWRGTFHGMARRAVTVFEEEFAIPAKDLLVWIGPAISGKNYEVDEALCEKFRKEWGAALLSRSPFRVDLPGLNRRQLVEAGLDPDNIETTAICTFDSNRCFSHRRGDSPQGRMMGAIAKPI